MAHEQDILRLPPPKTPPRLTVRRIGIHTSTAGGVENAAERACRLGCSTSRYFLPARASGSPTARPQQCAEMSRLRAKYNLKAPGDPCQLSAEPGGRQSEFYAKLSPHSAARWNAPWRCAPNILWCIQDLSGHDSREGLARAVYAIRAAHGLDLAKGGLTVLIENTAGAEYSLGGSFEQVAALVGVLRDIVPCAACMDTCHIHVAGYDIVTEKATRPRCDKSTRPSG